MRFAWFSPWPPQSSGIAGRSCELVGALAARGHGVDVFVDERDASVAPAVTKARDSACAPGEIRVQSAHDFVWRTLLRQYDLAVYQIGNSRLHEFVWPYLFKWPGLTVLHDARLHHARGRALLSRNRTNDYRAEFAYDQPALSPDLAELAVRGFGGPYYYDWPMIRTVVERSRSIACHARGAAAQLHEQFPSASIEYVALGEGRADWDQTAMAQSFRAAHEIPAESVVFGVHGALTTEKRIPEILRAFSAVRSWLGPARLLLAGRRDPRVDVDRLARELKLTDLVHVIDGLDDQAFDAAIAATDVSLNLRWPTALETSGPWLRALALGRATVITDLAHQGHLPVLDPRTWRRHAPCDDTSDQADRRAIAVAIDILDEDHSLRLAIRRLGVDHSLRRQLGAQARAYWMQEHTVDRMIGDFEAAAERALDAPEPQASGPGHLTPDALAFARQLLSACDATVDFM
jgi:glycosyltransferase involved in cell wall biosynthesis